MLNDSWDTWEIDNSYYNNSFYRDLSVDKSTFWEGPLNSNDFFHGKGIEHTEKHIAVGTYNNGIRQDWWLILQKSNLVDPWRGLVLFDKGEIIDAESFGFSSNGNMKEEFVESLHNDNYNIDFNTNTATEDDLVVPIVPTKVHN